MLWLMPCDGVGAIWVISFKLTLTVYASVAGVLSCTDALINNPLFIPLLHLHLSLNREGRWSTIDDFTAISSILSVLHALWDVTNSMPVHSPMLSSHFFFCLLRFLPPFTVPCKMVWAWHDKGIHVHTTSACVSVRLSGLHVAQLPAGSWCGLPRW